MIDVIGDAVEVYLSVVESVIGSGVEVMGDSVVDDGVTGASVVDVDVDGDTVGVIGDSIVDGYAGGVIGAGDDWTHKIHVSKKLVKNIF